MILFLQIMCLLWFVMLRVLCNIKSPRKRMAVMYNVNFELWTYCNLYGFDWVYNSVFCVFISSYSCCCSYHYREYNIGDEEG